MGAEIVRVGVRELRQGLSGYLRQASAGVSIIVTSRDKVIAELGPPSAAAMPARRGGMLKGKIHIPDDFETWPEGFLDSIEADL